MGFLFRLVFLYLPLAAVVAVGFALVYGIEDRPLVDTRRPLSAEDIARGRMLADRYDLRGLPTDRTTPITLTAREIDALLNATMEASDKVRAEATLRPYGLVLATTLTLPAKFGPLGQYLNLRIALPPSKDGFEVSRLAIGRIEVPASLVKPALALGIDLLVGKGKGKPVIDSVRSVSFTGNRVTVLYRPPARMIEDLRDAALDATSVASPEKVRIYYDAIGDGARSIKGRGPFSLAAFVGAAFRLAKERSATHDPVEENRAALLALAIQFGEPRLARLVDHKFAEEVKAHPPAPVNVRLQGRGDWVQHFIVSAGLALSGGVRVADVIGTVKEVDDITHSSGFSFTDLAADRTGTRLAHTATASSGAARRTQEMLAGRIDEDVFFPLVRDLPESMSGAEFKRRYGDIHDDRYLHMVMEIDRRIDQIALYQ